MNMCMRVNNATLLQPQHRRLCTHSTTAVLGDTIPSRTQRIRNCAEFSALLQDSHTSCMIAPADHNPTPIPFLSPLSHAQNAQIFNLAPKMSRALLELNICLYFTLSFRQYRDYLYLPILSYYISEMNLKAITSSVTPREVPFIRVRNPTRCN